MTSAPTGIAAAHSTFIPPCEMLTARARWIDPSCRSETRQAISIAASAGAGRPPRSDSSAMTSIGWSKRHSDKIVLWSTGRSPLTGSPCLSSIEIGVPSRDVAISADQHSARRDVLDQAQFTPLADDQGADPKQGQMAFAAAPIGRPGRRVPERVQGSFDRKFVHHQPRALRRASAFACPSGDCRPAPRRVAIPVQPYRFLALTSVTDELGTNNEFATPPEQA